MIKRKSFTLIHEVLGDAVTTIVTSSKLEVSHESFCDEMKQIVQKLEQILMQKWRMLNYVKLWLMQLIITKLVKNSIKV